MYYATTDTDENGRIAENANIHAFRSRPFAESFVRAAFPYLSTVVEGEFSDCWIKTTDPENTDTSPFDADQLIVRGPGGHPGLPGTTWIEPRVPVLVAEAVVEDD